MWQCRTTGCGVRKAIAEADKFSDRFHRLLLRRRGLGIKDPLHIDTKRPVQCIVAIFSAIAFYDAGSKIVSYGSMTVGQLFIYTGPGFYLSFNPISDLYWEISLAHLNPDGTVDDDLPVPQEIRGEVGSSYRWHLAPGPQLDLDSLTVGRFGENLLHE